MSIRVFKYSQSFPLECGEHLPEIELAYQTYGSLNKNRDNIIWVCHALTGNTEVDKWWPNMLGSGKILDTNRYFIVCVNMLGSCYGSTYALSINPLTKEPYYHQFPLITIRDMVRAYELLRVHLGINRIHMILGGSMGGQQSLEWAVSQPDLFDFVIPIACNARHSPWGIAFNESQRMAIQADATWKEAHPRAGMAGMRAARAMALLSYRNYITYETTQQDPNPDILERFRATTYQQYQGEKLVQRFDAFAYWTLSQAMDAHNVGRGRNGIYKALSQVKAHTLVIGVNSDVLFPPSEQQFIANHIPQAQYQELNSLYGHDGFLIEIDQLSQYIRDFIDRYSSSTPSRQAKQELTQIPPYKDGLRDGEV